MGEGVGAVAGEAIPQDVREEALSSAVGEVPDIQVKILPDDAEPEREKQPLLAGEGSRLALVLVHTDAVTREPGDDRFGSYELFVREKLDDRIQSEIRGGLRESIVDARVRKAGLDRAEVDALTRVARVKAIAVSEKGEKAANEILNMLLPAAFMLLLFASVMTGGQYLMTTTIEEKSSRVVEVLLSALSPMQLMTGKILGQMGVGFVILGVYAGMGMTALASFALLGLVDPWLLFYLVIFYVISYVVVASLMAAVGAAVTEMREAQSFMGPVMVVMTIPWILWMPISRDPNSVFALVTSFLPPINSFVMLIRMASTTPPPLWQVWLSIGIGVLAVWAGLWFAAKIFRIGLLLFGKPPDLKTLVRWARMA
jgi:ABC-type Na+ efflux pump permease subunit